MKIFAILLIVMSSLLMGCIVAEPAYEGENHGYRDGNRGDRDRDGARGERDRDGDGVANRQDRRPDDSRRY